MACCRTGPNGGCCGESHCFIVVSDEGETSCPKSEDGHCDCWYDDEGPCCRCGYDGKSSARGHVVVG